MTLASLVRARIIDPVRRAQGSPRSIARGVALGTWLTLTPTVGVQMPIAAAIAIPWSANLPIAIAIVWLSNPLTIIPLYYFFYWTGTRLLMQDPRSYRDLAREFKRMGEAVAAEGWSGFLDAMDVLGSEVLWPMILGSLVIATVAAVPMYHLTLRWAARRQARRLEEQAAATVVEGAEESAP